MDHVSRQLMSYQELRCIRRPAQIVIKPQPPTDEHPEKSPNCP